MPPQSSPDAQDALALPPTFSPDSLDSITELTTILSRLRSAIQAAPGPGGIPGGTPLPSSGASPAGTGSLGKDGGLSLKDVPGATDHLKHKLQKARMQVKALPDMERGMAEQEVEIKELEERIRMQREVLERLKAGGARFSAAEAARGEKEG
ncbi:uncharacterized protein DNG_07114 [Cephalotrichum gorgonifer]|uniref:Mediator of RNA polymerase II transcription subunit 9 n=1 Tax=Cephalotrichum gorgonifer TaxID=2041049 RepID=A0AAE8N2Q8_9PEZI|nr:uncharacterized protein DNG_07114 [Cephalotrichum gorgonifer]